MCGFSLNFTRVEQGIVFLLLCFSFIFFCNACTSPAERIEEMIVSLEDGDPIERRKAALALAGARQEAKAAVPALIVALNDRHWKVKNAVVHALKRIGTKEARQALQSQVPYYISALGHSNPEVRWFAADGLGYFGKDGKKALPILAKTMHDPNEAVRNTAAFSFQKIRAATKNGQ